MLRCDILKHFKFILEYNGDLPVDMSNNKDGYHKRNLNRLKRSVVSLKLKVLCIQEYQKC